MSHKQVFVVGFVPALQHCYLMYATLCVCCCLLLLIMLCVSMLQYNGKMNFVGRTVVEHVAQLVADSANINSNPEPKSLNS